METQDEKFNIDLVTTTFKSSLSDEDDVLMDEYLRAFDEINKFFILLGSVFGFVSSDIRAKLDILAELLENDRTHFKSIKNMMIYEKDGDLLNDKKYVSGSRTLLRLHRGLEFVYEFLLRLGPLDDKENANSVCKSAYDDTLAKHHGFIIRKGAAMAMYALPTKGDLMKRVCVDVERAIQTLPEMLECTKIVYDRTDQLYTTYELHGLP